MVMMFILYYMKYDTNIDRSKYDQAYSTTKNVEIEEFKKMNVWILSELVFFCQHDKFIFINQLTSFLDDSEQSTDAQFVCQSIQVQENENKDMFMAHRQENQTMQVQKNEILEIKLSLLETKWKGKQIAQNG